jgi:hypothetical protein
MHGLLKFLSVLGKYVLLPVGVLMLAGAIYLAVDTRAWLARAVEAPGTVIEMVRVRDSDSGSYMFAPLVRFATAEGKTIEFQSTLQTNPPAYHAGESVTVLYDPAKPNSAAISGWFSIWAVPLILGIVGAGFTVFGFGAAMVGRWMPGVA